MILGNFQFTLQNGSVNSLARTTEFKWSEVERIGSLPLFQNLGKNKDTIELEGVFYPKLNSGVYNTIDSIRNSNLCTTPNNLILDSGEILGKFVITSIKETLLTFSSDGTPQKVEFSMTLKCVSDTKLYTTTTNSSGLNTALEIAKRLSLW